jgi:serine/threonine protein kinase
MDKDKPAHPGAEQLSAFALGHLDAAEAAEIERHVADCTACSQMLGSLPDDQLVALLRQAFRKPPDAAPASEATTVLPSAAPAGPQTPAELAEHPRYRILEVLGRGGMGVVYKAEHRLMERPVALKVIDRGLTGDPAVVERFHREVKAAGRLNHPNIVHAYDADRAGDNHFLVMEFVEGTTLARRVEQEGPLPVDEACDAVRQAARGLQRAHEHGMVHRDIKPHNLMQTPGGQVKVLDFGLARLVREAIPPLSSAEERTPAGAVSPGLTQLGMVMGTADFMAPEQAADAHAADIRADIYSLGCTLYYLFTGRPPFPEGTVLDKLIAHQQRTPRPLSDFRADVPADLERVLERMMAKDPAGRYQTPAEVADALRPFTVPQPVRAVWSHRIWYLAAAAALLLVGIFAAAFIAFLPSQGESVLRTFGPNDKPLARDGVTLDQDSWRIEVKEPRIVPLFEIADPDVESCRLIYRAKLKTEDLRGKAYLEMRCRFPDAGEFFSKGLDNPLLGTTDWVSRETPFFLKKGERPDLLKLNVVIEGTGTLWIKDISLRKASLPLGF